MDLEQRAWFLRIRFEAINGQVPAIVGAEKGRGLAQSKWPARPAARKGITQPTSGKWSWPPFVSSRGLLNVTRRSKWLETSNRPEKSPFKLKRRSGGSPLLRIAVQHPKKLPRL